MDKQKIIEEIIQEKREHFDHFTKSELKRLIDDVAKRQSAYLDAKENLDEARKFLASFEVKEFDASMYM